MKAIINKDGRIEFDLYALLGEMSGEALATVADALSITDAVVKNVADQIVTGWTDQSSSAGRCIPSPIEPIDGMDYAIRLVAKASSDVAKTEIERLESALKVAREQLQNLLEEQAEERRRMAQVY